MPNEQRRRLSPNCEDLAPFVWGDTTTSHGRRARAHEGIGGEDEAETEAHPAPEEGSYQATRQRRADARHCAALQRQPQHDFAVISVNPAVCNPAWMSFVSALGTPMIALIVGGFGGLIAYRQWRTARDRLKLDLFDRRLPIYEQTRDLLARRMALGQLDNNEITEFAIKTRVSRWLFDQILADYLEEIVGKLLEISNLNSELETLTDKAERDRNVGMQRELKNWLDDQVYRTRTLDARFADFLHVRH
jgi:hypothetical protein